MKLFIIADRYGTELSAPHVFKTEVEANSYIKRCIVTDLCVNHADKMEELGLDCNSDPDEILAWGMAKGLCTTDTYIGPDAWHEFQVTTVLMEDIFREEILSLLDELEEIRQKAAEKSNHYDTDYAIRLCEATVATKCGIPSRAKWTTMLKENPDSKYYDRYHNGNFHL